MNSLRIRPATLASVSALIAIVLLAVTYIASLGVRLGPPNDRTTITFTIADVNGLVVGSNVLLRGIPIGKVSELHQSPNGAVVTVYYADRFSIPLDTDIRVDNLSALGESYVGFLPRTRDGPAIADGQRLGTEAITQPPSVAELAASVVRLLNQIEPEQLAHIVGELDRALPRESAVLTRLNRASAVLAATVASMPGQGKEVLANLQTLLRNAGFVGPNLAAAGPDLASVGVEYRYTTVAAFDVLRAGIGGPNNIIEFGDYLARVQEFLDNSSPDLATLAETLLPNIRATTQSIRNVDLSQILSSAMESVAPDGSITLHVNVPGP
jgi:phospholipid/cholesterol/gamma-HCH transport system substrate-binding protein